MTVARWVCQRWVSKSRRCGARMTPDGKGGYRCPRCQDPTTPAPYHS